MDLPLQVQVSRDELGREILDVNDHLNYACSVQFLGGAEQWQRTKATSPYLHGDITIWRARDQVKEPVVIEVYGDTAAEADANLSVLILAFLQTQFALTVRIGGVLFTYSCESADYQVTWSGPRWLACQLQVTFQVPRRPNVRPDIGTTITAEPGDVWRMLPARGTTVTVTTDDILSLTPVDVTVATGVDSDYYVTTG